MGHVVSGAEILMTGTCRGWRCARAALIAAAGSVALLRSASAQTLASWVSAVNGSWNDPTRWSTNPVFPNDTPATHYAASIAATGAPYTVFLGVDISLTDGLNLDGSNST